MKSSRSISQETLFRFISGTSATFVVLVLFGISFLLFFKGIKTFVDISPLRFIQDKIWNPEAYGRPSYGILPMIVSTFMVTSISMLIAVPVGIGSSIFISEVAPEKIKRILKTIVELIAGIPSVMLGFFGIVVIGPILVQIFKIKSGLCALNGSILLAFMALPTIISISEDIISSLPHSYREASLALGATKWETIVYVVVPASMPGIISAILLGFGRAMGETMTVLMVAGNASSMPHSIFDPVQTMTATIAMELGEVASGTTHYHSLFLIGLILFIFSLIINLSAEGIKKRMIKIK